jgi:hypothetical protein
MSTTNSKTRFSLFGIAAIVAILTISLVTTGLSTQEVTAEAARKVGMSANANQIAPAIQAQSQEISPVAIPLGHMSLKSNDKGDWMVEGVIECATAIKAKAKGKQDTLSGGTAGAKVWVELDNKPISIATGEPIKGGETLADAQWNLCEQTFEIQSNFNDLIIDCDDALTNYNSTYAGCLDADPNKLVFLCDVDSTITECEQSLEVFTKVAGTHPIAVMLHNVDAGESRSIDVYAHLSAGPSSNSTLYSTDVDPVEDNFVDAGVVIGKRLFSVETLAYQG